MLNFMDRFMPMRDAAGEGAAGGAAVGAGAAAAGSAAAGAAGAAAGGAAAGGDKPFYDSWGLDDDGKKIIADRGIKAPSDIIKSWSEADKMARARNVIEKPDATKPQDWKGFTEIGWVEDLAKYVVAKPEVKAGQQLDEQMFGDFGKLAHQAKVAPWQAKIIFDGMFENIHARGAELETRAAGQMAELKTQLEKEWGPQAKARTERASRAMQFLGFGAEDVGELEKIAGSARTLKMFDKLAQMVGEDSLNVPNNGDNGGLSPEAAGAERRKLEADPAWMAIFNNPRHPSHKDYNAKRQQLLEIEARQKAA